MSKNKLFDDFQQWNKLSEEERKHATDRLNNLTNCNVLAFSLSQYQEVLKELISQIEDWECDHKSSYDGKEQIPTSVFRETVEKAKEML